MNKIFVNIVLGGINDIYMHNKMYCKTGGASVKNPCIMLPTMHIFGNIDTLEIPSKLIHIDAYINNSLPLCADNVLPRERALIQTLI